MSMDGQMAGAIAYEELHVPALFAQWSEPVLDAAGVVRGQRVLDVACGTGVLARSALARVGAAGTVTGVDPDPGMLEVARRIEPSITWLRGVAESLELADASFDVVVSQFGMMYFTDRVRAIREMARVLETGHNLAVAVWDALEKSPVYAVEVALLEEMVGRAAADALRAPFVLGDPADTAQVFEAAGLDEITVSSRTGTARFPSVKALVGADLRGWLPVMGVELAEDLIVEILERAETALSEFVGPDGSVVFGAPAHFVSGRKV
jgi:ubiquinone/menaquinone biosynthesis C-methylase UbiE